MIGIFKTISFITPKPSNGYKFTSANLFCKPSIHQSMSWHVWLYRAVDPKLIYMYIQWLTVTTYRLGSWTSIENFLSLKYKFSKYFHGNTWKNTTDLDHHCSSLPVHVSSFFSHTGTTTWELLMLHEKTILYVSFAFPIEIYIYFTRTHIYRSMWQILLDLIWQAICIHYNYEKAHAFL